MTLTVEEKKLLRKATLKPEEFAKLHKMRVRVVYQAYYPAWVLSVLKELQKDYPKRKFRIRYQIVEITDDSKCCRGCHFFREIVNIDQPVGYCEKHNKFVEESFVCDCFQQG